MPAMKRSRSGDEAEVSLFPSPEAEEAWWASLVVGSPPDEVEAWPAPVPVLAPDDDTVWLAWLTGAPPPLPPSSLEDDDELWGMDIANTFYDPFDFRPYRCATTMRALHRRALLRSSNGRLDERLFAARAQSVCEVAAHLAALYLAHRLGPLGLAADAPAGAFRVLDAAWQRVPDDAGPTHRAWSGVFFPPRGPLHAHGGWNAGNTLVRDTTLSGAPSSSGAARGPR